MICGSRRNLLPGGAEWPLKFVAVCSWSAPSNSVVYDIQEAKFVIGREDVVDSSKRRVDVILNEADELRTPAFGYDDDVTGLQGHVHERHVKRGFAGFLPFDDIAGEKA